MIRRDVLRALSLGALACSGIGVRAQSYPSRPVTLLVGGAPGSVPDIMARPIAQRLAAALGQPVVVENRPGAAGSLAMSALLQSAADGQTLALATMSQAVFNTYLFAKLPYDPLRDLEPVAPLVTGAMALAAHPSFPARTLGEFVALAKAQPGKYLGRHSAVGFAAAHHRAAAEPRDRHRGHDGAAQVGRRSGARRRLG